MKDLYLVVLKCCRKFFGVEEGKAPPAGEPRNSAILTIFSPFGVDLIKHGMEPERKVKLCGSMMVNEEGVSQKV